MKPSKETPCTKCEHYNNGEGTKDICLSCERIERAVGIPKEPKPMVKTIMFDVEGIPAPPPDTASIQQLVFDQLSDKDVTIIQQYYIWAWSIESIAKFWKVSQRSAYRRINQAKYRALNALQNIRRGL